MSFLSSSEPTPELPARRDTLSSSMQKYLQSDFKTHAKMIQQIKGQPWINSTTGQ